MTTVIAIPDARDELTALAQMAVQSLGSPSSRRNYARSIRLFLASSFNLTREGVLGYLRQLERQRKGPVTRNVALAAIRLLAMEANVRGLLPNVELAAIDRIRGAKMSGVRTGNWLSGEQVMALLQVAGGRREGTRDAALVACMVGCGLRRAEVCTLEWEQWQLRDERWVWVDVRGKAGRVRSAAAPDWAAERINEWRNQTNGATDANDD
jgi:integrase